MRVVFMGFQTWGLVTLESILRTSNEVVLVVTHPSTTDEYAQHFTDSVADFASLRHVPVLEAPKTTSDVAHRIRVLEPDIIVSSNWRSYVPPAVLNYPKHGGVNVHRSLLPRYGGFAPINWAIANGEIQTGVTIHAMSANFDLGDVALQEALPIGPDDTATDVFHKTTPLIQRLVPEVLRQIEMGTAHFVPQDPREAEFFHARGERELRINWSEPNVKVRNLIRAQSDPFANAYTLFDGRKMRVKTAFLPERRYRGSPGRVCFKADGGVVVLCGESADGRGQGLVITDVQIDGHPPCAAVEAFPRLGFYLE